MTKKPTEIAVPERPGAAVAHVQEVTLEAQMAYASEIAKSGLIPETFRKRPENILVAIEWGRELGLTPIASLNEIYVVHGTPSLSAKSMLMLARRAGHRVRVAGDTQEATCEIVRADDPEYPHKVTYTLAEAKQAGLMKNAAWQNNPTTMLRWRAIANCVRLACPEVLGGISYLPEEVEEIARRNQSRTTVVTQVQPVVADDGPSVQDFMKRLAITGVELRQFACRVLGVEVAAWRDLDAGQRRLVHEGLARWAAEGDDWTLVEQVDAELIDVETGEVIQEAPDEG